MNPPQVICKAGVQLLPWTAEAGVIHGALEIASAITGRQIVITCGTEAHGPTDPHTMGRARDIRTSEWDATGILEVIAAIRQGFHQLTPAFPWVVIYESPTPPTDSRLAAMVSVNPNATAPHCHIQWPHGAVYPTPGG